MEHQTIAALVHSEQQTAGRDPHGQRRLDALRARDRHVAALARADRRRRLRARLALGIRRLAEFVEPPQPVRVSSASESC